MKELRFLTVISLFFMIAVLSTCTNDETLTVGYPRVNTLEVVNISNQGVTFGAELINEGNHSIVEYGFVWSETASPTLEHADKKVLVDQISNGRFSADITTTLQEGMSYVVRAYVKTDTYLVYGKDLDFQSLGSNAPRFDDFNPKIGAWVDTIFIKGGNFSYVKNNNLVKMGEINTVLVSATDSTLILIVPPVKNDNKVTISVSIKGNTALSTDKFSYLIPKINSVEPLTGTNNDTITIHGENFSRIKKYNTVHIGGIGARVASANTTEIKFIVPPDLITKENLIKVISSDVELINNEPFILN